MSKKSQAALEFLVTYSWAILGILIAVGALYYFGIFDFDKYLPDRCIFTSQMECMAFTLDKDAGEVRLKLVNNLGEPIAIQEVIISDDNNPKLTCTPPAPFPLPWNNGDEWDLVFTGCSGGGFLKKQIINVGVNVTYYAINTPSQPRHSVIGKLQGKVI